MRTSSPVFILSHCSRSSSARPIWSHYGPSFKHRACSTPLNLCYLRSSSVARQPTTGARTNSCEQRVSTAFPRNNSSFSSNMPSSGYQHCPQHVSASCNRVSFTIAGHSILLFLPAQRTTTGTLSSQSRRHRQDPAHAPPPSLHSGVYLPGYSSATLLINVPLSSLHTLLGLAPSRDFILSSRVPRIRSIFNQYLPMVNSNPTQQLPWPKSLM